MRSFSPYLIPGRVELVSGSGGLDLLRLRTRDAECEVYPYGAHVASFRPAGRPDLLWVSPYSYFEPGKPIRGGIPLCFPWFGPHRTRADLPLHGLVRTREWELISSAVLEDGRTTICFACSDTEDSKAIWPFSFRLEYTITLGQYLDLELTILNPGKESFACEEGLHTYFSVGNPELCDILGLEGVEFIDRVRGDSRGIQAGALRFTRETVNAYMHAPEICRLIDYPARWRISVEQSGMNSTVVWNPGESAGSRNPEIRETWNQFVCVESTNCLDCSLTVEPGAMHRSRVRLGAETI